MKNKIIKEFSKPIVITHFMVAFMGVTLFLLTNFT